MRRWLAIMIGMAVVCVCAEAAGAEMANCTLEDCVQVWMSWYFDEAEYTDWQTLGVPEDTRFPLYAAPYESAWRGARGQAEAVAGSGFETICATVDGRWLMVECPLAGGMNRVGWIRRPESAPRPEEYLTLEMDYAQLRLNHDAVLTDDPRGRQRPIAHLSAGDTVIGLASYRMTDDLPWMYVETTIDGSPAWGFLREDALEPVNNCHLEGNCVVIHEGVTALLSDLDWSLLEEEGLRLEDIAPPGTVSCTGELLVLIEKLWGENVTLILPSTLRILCSGALTELGMEELRVPVGGRLLASEGRMYLHRLILPVDYSGRIDNNIVSVDAYVVEEGNPFYKSVDGVLFSADGKRLIAYPAGKEDMHYDVPRGVEEICDDAFSCYLEILPLKTISLPIGLRRIGKRAFISCGRLQSLTVPLTVTELGEDCFAECVSLERLSLPPGLAADGISDWAEQADFTFYNGDNGTTQRMPSDD